MSFGTIILNQSIKRLQNYVMWILTALLFILKIHIKNFYEDISDADVKQFDTSNYSDDDKRPRPRSMNKKVIGLFKDELGRKIMTELVAFRPKTYSYLMDDDDNSIKKLKEQKNLSPMIIKIACLRME